MFKQCIKTGFTLIELLVVISIIAILMAIMMPALARVREQARQIFCMSNVRSLGQAVMTYSGDYDGRYPMGGSRDDGGYLYSSYPYSPYWDARLLPYLGAQGVDISIDTGLTTEGGRRENWHMHEATLDVLICPAAHSINAERIRTIEQEQNRYPRSYRFNAYISGRVARSSDGYYLQQKSYYNSLRTSEVNQPSRTIMFTESQGIGSFNTLWGSQARGWFDVQPAHFVKFDGPTERSNDWNFERSFGRSNFVFADGHAQTLNTQFTESHNLNPGPAFTDYPDPIEGLKFHPTANW